jgi:heme oxygenase
VPLLNGNPSPSLLQQLREATREQHAALDRSLLTNDGALTRAHYEVLLLGSFAVLKLLEDRLVTWFHQFAEPSRKDCLERDLVELGVSTPAPEVSVPQVQSLAEAFGCAYVVEGSALGGMVMARSLPELLGSRQHAQRYLTLRGEQTGPHFRGFCRELEVWGATASPEQWNLACSGASSTFSAYAGGIRAARETLSVLLAQQGARVDTQTPARR